MNGVAVRRWIKQLEADQDVLKQLRADAKTEGGKLTQFGRDVLWAAKKNGIKRADMARLLDITQGAVTPYYK
ncbi:hypothetical protein [Siccirubricoccus deserti]|jgi:hypothetical protein|uniref:Uncharacterized protein n=1 Tax=Siccirubricoccus deserti TaxID=2013562 RepID=A0A9X0R358_9PROT|nr:hypothetical protein [Siccirubricoccus deserti]MBC4018589.1 hypothetical protein [Siccirubricoccus deserti]